MAARSDMTPRERALREELEHLLVRVKEIADELRALGARDVPLVEAWSHASGGEAMRTDQILARAGVPHGKCTYALHKLAELVTTGRLRCDPPPVRWTV